MFLDSWEKPFGVICSGSEVVFPVRFSCASLGKSNISPSASVQLFKHHTPTPGARWLQGLAPPGPTLHPLPALEGPVGSLYWQDSKLQPFGSSD